ncbi:MULTISPECIES: restriction endonuclease subunit S [Nocardiaceae]|uniref:Restriction endonuclease subunit S n=1 Tax=Rhodococcoides kroppenstedtii TaxID=293050 RepID=A0ABS7NPU1_9NOCA|nr:MULTISPECIES: restriction endonuclease subunit S [Rhodococcus]AMY19737.1 hypothetical protein A3Q40_02366 [Rhodococcus sp. PBTS 1]MBY6312149.1 restriction endonuclease subunit S [Rhodococcus kroppenstedtii]MBY6319767.1 restriction endonuclease subunit S [Rhodococcus kroppenstedtii]MBY6398450.1 restriction endonuclease subunit S [Rhodococcus kroppenstedtii]
MSEWQSKTIADLGKVVTGSTPPSRKSNWFGESTPFVTPSDMTEGDRRPRPERWLSAEGLAGLRTRLIPRDSVAFVCIGSIGKVCLLESESVTNQQVNSVIPNANTDGRFLYYLLKHMAPSIAQSASGAATPIINKSTFSQVVVRLPGHATQLRIAAVLGGIDDLIENNRRRIEVLEEMARAIYREWFVKFRYPGHGDVPMVDSALGPIPEGWHVGRVGSFGRIVTGATPSTKQPRYWGEAHDTPFLTPTEMGWRRLYARPARHLSDAGVASVKSRLLPAGAVCFSSIGSIGKVTLAVKPLVTNQQVNSVVVDHSVTSESYVYEALSHASERIRGMASGSATPIINKSTFADIRMVMTPPSLAHLFGREVGLLHSLITKLEEHSSRLGAIRDLLLPQLVTGQIDVSSLNLDTLIAEKVA